MLHKRHAPMETRLKSGADVSRLLGRRSEHISGQSDDRAAVIFIRYIISSPVITFQNSDAKLRKRSAHSRAPGPDEHGASGVRHQLNLECCESYKDAFFYCCRASAARHASPAAKIRGSSRSATPLPHPSPTGRHDATAVRHPVINKAIDVIKHNCHF